MNLLQVVKTDLQKNAKITSYAIQVSDMSYVSDSNCCITNFPRTLWLRIIINDFHNSPGQLGDSDL